MLVRNKSLIVTIAVLIGLSAQSSQAAIAEGSYKGNSSLISDITSNDVMAFIVKKDPSTPGAFFAILAEYDRLPLTDINEKVAIAKWVNRMHIYSMKKDNDLSYSLRPLTVAANGEIVLKTGVNSSVLNLKRPGSLQGATLTRIEKNKLVESVEFSRRLVSTWEDYVSGKFFGTKARTGFDYLNKKVNTELTPAGIAKFNQEEIKGEYRVSEKLPGMYTFTANKAGNVGDDKVVSRIGVFIDIMNWKNWGFTTEELLMINPEHPEDVGFYYERH